MRRIFALFALVFLVIAPGVSFAVEPSEMLADPKLEARARELSSELTASSARMNRSMNRRRRSRMICAC